MRKFFNALNLMQIKNILLGFIILFSIQSIASEKGSPKVIKGNVYELIDGEKRPLPMAFVFVKKTDACSHSNFFGEFSIEMPEKSKEISISYEGFKKHTVKINKSTESVDIILKRDTSEFLSEK